MRSRSPLTPPRPEIDISGHGTVNIGGVHFHDSITIHAEETADPGRYITGYAHLLRRQQDVVARHLAGPLATPIAIESSLVRTWQDWCNSPDWYESVVHHGARLTSALDVKWRQTQAIRSWHEDTRAGRRTFAFIQQSLSRLELEPTLGLIQRHMVVEKSSAERERYGNGLQSCKWLLEQSGKPAFATLLNLAGHFGSGRSRLLADMSQCATAEGSLAFLLSPRPGETVGSAVYRYVAECTGISVRRFEDLRRFLETAPTQAKIHILVDDIDLWARAQPTVVDELQSLIDASTECGRVRWVFTADSNGLDAVSGSDPFFWVRHGSTPSTPSDSPQPALNRTTGWLDVDAANRAQRIGFEILRSRSAEDVADIDAVINDTDAFGHEFMHLVNPLAAWVRLESHEKAGYDGRLRQPLTDVNSIPFVREYWTWVTGRISRNDEGRQASLERAMRALASSQIFQPGDHVAIDASLAAQHEAALADLVSGGLIQTTWVGDPELDDQALRVDPTFPALLGLRIARLTLADTGTGADDAVSLSQWWPLAEQGLGLAESTCQFALTLSPPTEAGKDRALWKTWTTHQESPKAPLLMAATTCGADAEGVAIEYVSRPRYLPRTKREFFVLTRFAARAQLTDWSADRRIEALKRHAEAICSNGLEAYLHLTLTTLLESEHLLNMANYLDVCQSLDGFPSEQVRELTADLMVRAGARIYADDATAWIHTVLRYCKKQTHSLPRGNPPGRPRRVKGQDRRRPQGETEQPPFDAKSSFAVAFTSAVSKHIVATRGSDGLRMLAEIGWWTAADGYVYPALADHMRRNLTTEYGSTVHFLEGQHDRLDEYEAVVRDLLDGRLLGPHPEAGRIAYYLLKHSVPTYGRPDVMIPAQLRPLLRIIQRDPKLIHRLGPEVHLLLRRNGIGRGA